MSSFRQNKTNFLKKIIGIFLFALAFFIPYSAFAMPWHIIGGVSGSLGFSATRGHLEVNEGAMIDFGTKPVNTFDWSIPLRQSGMDPVTIDRGDVSIRVTNQDGTSEENMPVVSDISNEEYIVHAKLPNYTGMHYVSIRYFIAPTYHLIGGRAEFSYPIVRAKNGSSGGPNPGGTGFEFNLPAEYKNIDLSAFSCYLGNVKQPTCLSSQGDFNSLTIPAITNSDFFLHVSVPQEYILTFTNSSIEQGVLPEHYDSSAVDPIDAVYLSSMPNTNTPWKFEEGTMGGITFDNNPGHGHLHIRNTAVIDLGSTPVTSFDWIIRRKGSGMNPITFDYPPAIYLDDDNEAHPVNYQAFVIKNTTDDFYIMRVSLSGWKGRHMLVVSYHFVPQFDFSGDRAFFTFPFIIAKNGDIETTRQNFLAPVIVKNDSLGTVDSFYTCFLGSLKLSSCITRSPEADFIALPETNGRDVSFRVDVPKDVVYPVDGPALHSLPAFSAAMSNHPSGLGYIKNYVVNGDERKSSAMAIPFSKDDKVNITLLYLAGFFLQIIYSAVSRRFSFKDILTLVGSTLLFILLLLAPGKHETAAEYNFFSHVFFGTIIAGVGVMAFFKEKFAPRINEFTFLIWSLLLPYLFLTKHFSLFMVSVSAVPLLLAVINIYTDVDRYKKMRVLFYFLFIMILIAGSIIHVHGSNIRFFESQNAWYPYTASSFFFFGMLIAYVTPYIGFLLQFLRRKREDHEDYKTRRAALVESFSNNFNYLENFPLIYTLVGVVVVLGLYFNYRYNTISPTYMVTVVTILCQIIDLVLGEKTPILEASGQDLKI